MLLSEYKESPQAVSAHACTAQMFQLKDLMQQDQAAVSVCEHVQQSTAVLMMQQAGDTAVAYAAAATAPACAAESESGDMLIDHLTLANVQLRQVIQAAGLDPAPSLQPLRDLQHSIQRQQPRSSRQRALQDDDLLAALAEENYQLRQMVQQLHVQQQYWQQQHEAAVAASQGDPLELDRFRDSGVSSAVAADADVARANCSSSLNGASPALRAGATLDVASSATGLAAAPLHGPILPTPQSPAVMAAGILVPLSASAVQLVEAEAAAQLMTQAVIQAEAAAVYDGVTWQDDKAAHETHEVQLQQQEQEWLVGVQQPLQDQQLEGVDVNRLQLFDRMPLTADAEPASASSMEPTTVVDSATAVADNISSFGLLKLPKLLLPARALRRSFSRTRSIDAASEASHASNDIHQPNLTPRSENVTAGLPGTAAAAAAAGSFRSAAGSGSLGLKQLASELHLLPSHSRSGGVAADATFGAAAVVAGGAASHMVISTAHADAAATVATAAAAQLWYPAAVAALRDAAPVVAVSSNQTAAIVAAGSVPGSKWRSGAVGLASLQQQQQQQQQQEEGENLEPVAQLQGQLKALKVHSTCAVLPAQPVHSGVARFGIHTVGNRSAAAQAAVAAAAFAGQHPVLLQHDQRQVSEDLPALPKLRLHAKANPATVGPSSAAVADSTADIAAAGGSSSSSSPCSDSGFFRDASAAANLDDSTASLDLNMLPAAAGRTASHLPPPVPLAAGSSCTGFGLYRRYRGSEVFSSNGRISSDLFGARISMDGSVGLPPGVALTGHHTNCSSRDHLSDLAGWYGVSDTLGDAADGTITRTDTLTSNLNSSEFLGVSYQQSWQQQTDDGLQQGSAVYDSLGTGASAAAAPGAADVLHSSDQHWPSLPKLHLPGRRLQLQPVQRRSSTSSSTRDQQYLLHRQQQLSDTGTVESIGSLVAAPDIPDNYFFQDYVSSMASDGISSLRGLHTATIMQGSQIAATAAADSSSVSRPGSEVTLAGIDVLQQQMPEVAAAAANCSQPALQQQHLALPDLSILTLNVQARTQQPTPVIGHTPAVSALYGSVADSNCALQQEEQQADQDLFGSSPQLQQQLDPVPVAPAVAPALTAAAAAITTGELGCGISSEKLRQLLTDLAVAQEQQQQLLSAVTPRADDATSAGTPSTARSNGVLTMQASGPLSPLAVPPQAPAAAVPVGAGLQRQPSTGIPPKSPSREIPRRRQQQQVDGDLAASVAAAECSMSRALSAGSMGSQLPPKSGARSGSNGNLSAFATQQQQQLLSSSIRSPRDQFAAHDQQQQQHDQTHWQQQQSSDGNTHGAAAAVPCQERCRSITPTAAAAAGTAFRLSPGGGIHSRLRVVTAVRPPPSNGSNSDVETNSTTTTPLHHRGAHTRNNSSSSIPFRAGSGLASITVPPSPASSGVRYVPASPRIVGFDCPSTPLSILRSPSCRSDYSNAEPAAAASGMAVNHYGVGHLSFIAMGGVGGPCSSGCSTPRRQPTSPGLLHQALARHGHMNGCSSGSSTPLSRRAASTSAVPYPGLGVINGHSSLHHLPPAPLGNLPTAFAAHALNGGLLHDSNSQQQQQRQTSQSIEISPRGAPAGPLGVRSPPSAAAAAAAGVHGRARSCSATLLNILTGGAMQQQTGVQHVNTHIPYIQQPQPLPLQQQQQGHGGYHPSVLALQCESQAVRSMSAAAAEIGDNAAYGSAVEDAVDGELRAAAAATASGQIGYDRHGQAHMDHSSMHHDQYHHHHQQQRQLGFSCVSSSLRVSSATAAAAAAATHLPIAPVPAAAVHDRVHRPESPVGARSRSPLSRSISPTPLGGGSSSSSGPPFVAGAASPARSTQDGHHHVKLSRFGQMAAAAAEAHQITNLGSAAPPAAAVPAAAEAGSADGSEAHTACGHQLQVTDEALDDTAKSCGAAAAAGMVADLRYGAHLSAASSVASPETPAIVEAAHAAAAGGGCDSGTDITPTAAATAMAQNGFEAVAMAVDQQMPSAAASIQYRTRSASATAAAVAAAELSEAETAAIPAGLQAAALQTSQQQEEQPATAQAGQGVAAPSAAAARLGSSSSALLSSLCGQKHHEMVLATSNRWRRSSSY